MVYWMCMLHASKTGALWKCEAVSTHAGGMRIAQKPRTMLPQPYLLILTSTPSVEDLNMSPEY